MRFVFFLASLLSIISLSAIDLGFDRETISIKPYLTDPASCLSCHKETEESMLRDTALSCDTHCLSCHGDITVAHHPTGIRNRRTDATLVLTKFGRIGCRTCHDLHVKRFDSEAWKSETLFQRIFNHQERYKTYFLFKKNTNGELCRQCHF